MKNHEFLSHLKRQCASHPCELTRTLDEPSLYSLCEHALERYLPGAEVTIEVVACLVQVLTSARYDLDDIMRLLQLNLFAKEVAHA